ncbi:MAG: hypothetical protein OCD01_15800 [Fibrobacterales bacterium]
MIRSWYKLGCCVLLLLMSSQLFGRSGGVGGYSMYPTVMVLDLEKNEFTAKTTLVYPKANGKNPIPIEIEVFDRTLDENGRAVKSEKQSKDFVAYPAQTVLRPGGSKIIHLQWVGRNIPNQEKQYVVVSRQVVVKGLQENHNPLKPMGAMTAVVKYEGVLVLSSQKFEPLLEVTNFGSMVAGKKILEVMLHNKGTKSQSLKGLKFKVRLLNGKQVVITPRFTDVKRLKNGVPAQGKRVLYFDETDEVKATTIQNMSVFFDVL